MPQNKHMDKKVFQFSLVFFWILMGYGQSLRLTPQVVPFKEKMTYQKQAKVTLANCGQDTIKYTGGKQISSSNSLAALILRSDGDGVSGISHALQWFEVKDSLYIHGAQFVGALLPGADPNDSIQVKVEIYEGDTVGGFSNTTPTVSDTIWVTATSGGDIYTASFPNVLVTGSFGISVMNLDTANFYILLNDSMGYNAGWGENLSYARIFFSGFYSPWISLYDNGFDYDYLIFPIVSYPLHTQFTIPDTISLGDTLRPVNTSTYHYYSKFYNVGIFDNIFWGNGVDPLDQWVPIWDFGDGTQKKDTIRETWHVYTSPGSYTVALNNVIQPWHVSACNEIYTDTVYVKDTTVVGLNHSTITDVNLFTIRDNPVQEYLTLTMNPKVNGPFQIVIYTMIGQKVYEHRSEEYQIEIPVSTLPNGIYFVEVSVGTKKAVKRFIKSQ